MVKGGADKLDRADGCTCVDVCMCHVVHTLILARRHFPRTFRYLSPDLKTERAKPYLL